MVLEEVTLWLLQAHLPAHRLLSVSLASSLVVPSQGF